MSQEKESSQKGSSGSFADPSFMKKFQEMLEKGDFDCAQMMSRMRAMCCGAPEQPEEQEDRVEEKKD